MSKVQEESVIPTNKELISGMKAQHSNLKLQTNRYKFTEKIIDLLSDFAKMHQHEGSKEYKESWQNWIADSEINRELEEEKSRLIKEGMVGDVIDKLYKSSRYYYRKKINKNEERPKERKKYEGLTKEILHKMDAHIIREINGSIDLLEDDKMVIDASEYCGFLVVAKAAEACLLRLPRFTYSVKSLGKVIARIQSCISIYDCISSSIKKVTFNIS